ncbi:Radical SAM superfamily enzyme YgiQ, UPF0313 family [Dethiosulfatibacter aminovorans DSM 17477]|uniref:Radical SAM superfamily enzyme YgiQ, UPF0313 family n=1 Tax=Dethiosulfatibacter aminovorans DSM 17477 TaxID=1121476 RepID=A0A1M6GY78_9FIRM|nr:B12-binding domain-containing radical SAM protein [Dethiosulfatibacter aminovorans]SHJ14928.1 Radical SAM superfamily enzyme YgiQ, UPF0313 family [Dethiosulfatibacter aminovorans DSM 17477]
MKMKVLFVALNSKYSHVNLAIRYMSNSIRDIKGIESDFLEFTINQKEDYILWEILEAKADIVCFSSYIWNINEILSLSESLKMGNESIKILLGGPEVTFESVELLNDNEFIDYVIKGEGELPVREFFGKMSQGEDIDSVKGLTYRKNGAVVENANYGPIKDMAAIEYPYGIGESFKNKYVYYESSRGCPFNCSFCISSSINGVSNLPLERVKDDLDKLLKTEANVIKFVDRTFNTDRKRAVEIINHIVKNNHKRMKIHFEITAEILDDNMISLINDLPEDMFQFEIGVQSTNPYTLNAVNRKSDIVKLRDIVERIGAGNNVHRHLDLIAGLPEEDMESFGKSFNDVYNMKVEKIQLGFLKVLKGTEIRKNAEKYGIVYKKTAPYEVIKTDSMSSKELLYLKKIEELVDIFYNEHHFINSIEKLMTIYEPFEFFKTFCSYWISEGLFDKPLKKSEMYGIINDFALNVPGIDISAELIDDFLFNERNLDLPSFFDEIHEKECLKFKHELLKSENFRNKYFTGCEGIQNKRLVNRFRLVRNDDKYIAYIYGDKRNIFSRSIKIDVTDILEEELNDIL